MFWTLSCCFCVRQWLFWQNITKSFPSQNKSTYAKGIPHKIQHCSAISYCSSVACQWYYQLRITCNPIIQITSGSSATVREGALWFLCFPSFSSLTERDNTHTISTYTEMAEGENKFLLLSVLSGHKMLKRDLLTSSLQSSKSPLSLPCLWSRVSKMQIFLCLISAKSHLKEPLPHTGGKD